jgi:hypothetical protein
MRSALSWDSSGLRSATDVEAKDSLAPCGAVAPRSAGEAEMGLDPLHQLGGGVSASKGVLS